MELNEFFKEHNKIALGFSGGVDSAYLLYAAIKNGADVSAYFVKSAFQPQFELDDAKNLAQELNAKLTVINCDVLADDMVASNPQNRCYYCKKQIFGLIKEQALKDGYTELIDGNNASDDASDRPGMRALDELNVLSPLRMCGITKDEIRKRSKEAGLVTWDKPAYACLATRIPTGEGITAEKLTLVDNAEEAMRRLGYSDFRVRLFSGAARLQLKEYDFIKAVNQREEILDALKPWFNDVLLDLKKR